MKRHHDKPSVCEREALEQQLEELQRQVRQLQLEQDILKAANEILKKDVASTGSP